MLKIPGKEYKELWTFFSEEYLSHRIFKRLVENEKMKVFLMGSIFEIVYPHILLLMRLKIPLYVFKHIFFLLGVFK